MEERNAPRRTRRNGEDVGDPVAADGPGAVAEGDPLAAEPANVPAPPETVDHPPAALPFLVVGIGASAGGLEAMTELLAHLPADTGMAFVLVQHLHPTHASLLAPLLGRKTEMTVVTAEDGMGLQPNRLYVIPPDRALRLERARLRLAPRGPAPESHYTVDTFFRSLAAAQRHLAIGVVLSGADSDGALGIAAIKEHGGMALAQEPATAAHPGMPRHAIDTGAVDLVGSPERLAGELRRIAAASSRTLVTLPPLSDGTIRSIFRLLQEATDVDFTLYKPSTIQRRLARRMVLVGARSLPDYLRYLQGQPAELDALYQDLLITVTRFFRDREAFDVLAEKVWPVVLAARSQQDRPIRIWVPGCSTGEECYSLAISLFEYLEAHAPGTPVQIFGTDVSEEMLERARAGVYQEDIKIDVSPERLQRYFAKVDGGFRIAKALRDACIFARQNLTRDPPSSGLDLVSCRNVLIYLNPQAQRRILPVFHFALRPSGFLLLGSAETVGSHADLFRLVHKRQSLYANEAVPSRFDWEPARRERPDRSAAAGDVEPLPQPRCAGRRIAEVEAQLEGAREALRTVVDEQASINEELRSANEEVIASNEELHATNEELEAARAELQATNEELASLNEQLQRRNRDLNQLTNDLTNLLAGLNMPILMVGRDLRFRRITPLATRVLNVRPSDVGRPVYEIRTGLTGPPLESLVQEVLESLVAKEVEVEDASGRPWRLRIRPYKTEEQRIDGVVIVLVDVSDIRAVAAGLQGAREYADVIVATVRQPLVVVDADGRVRSANPAFCRAFRLHEGEVVGRSLAEIGHGIWGRQPVSGLLRQALAEEQGFHEATVEGDFGPAGHRRVVLTARRIEPVSGEAPLVLLAIDDVTARVPGLGLAPGDQAVRDEREAREEAEASSRAKDVFLATLSHELRTPLTSMLGWVRMLRSGQLDAGTTGRALEALERNTKAQVQLIEDLLDVSRVTSGKLRLDFRPVDLALIARAAADVVRPAALAKGVRLVVEGDGGPIVLGDRERLQQVVWNLLSNAIKFTPTDGTVALSVRRTDGQAELTVRDDGAGIAPELLPRLFERFGRGETPMGRSRGGLGLGLAIVRHIVELHGGTARADSPGANRGATFTVALPVAPATSVQMQIAASSATPALAGEAPPTGHPVLTGADLLLVEDDADAREMLTAVLVQFGARVTATGSAREAMEALEQAVPDLVVADIAMPDEDGYGFIRRMRALPVDRGGRVPAVALTAYARREDAEQALLAGFNVHLAKPIDPVVLGLSLAQLLGRTTNR